MKSLFALLSILLIGVEFAACNGTRRGASRPSSRSPRRSFTEGGSPASSSGTRTQGYLNDGDNDIVGDSDDDHADDNDNDNDNPTLAEGNTSYHDNDDSRIVAYGHPASAAVVRQVTKIVERYYATATAGDGRRACAMLVPGIARAVPEDYDQTLSPSHPRSDRTCGAVLSLLFRHARTQLRAAIAVTGVRGMGNQVVALLGSSATTAGYISLLHEAGSWKVVQLLGNPLP